MIMSKEMNKTLCARKCLMFLSAFFGVFLALSITAENAEAAKRNMVMLGCWGDADRGDSYELKMQFVGNGAMVQYDENQVEKRKRSFGAWEMEAGSKFLNIFWPSGRTTQYYVKRIGPILHFAGQRGAKNFTLREISPEYCWQPRT
jgi:hypothetical protein